MAEQAALDLDANPGAQVADPESLAKLRAELERHTNPFALLIRRYARDRRAFVREVLGATPDGWQSKTLSALDAGFRRLSIRSGHGVGKSTLCAWVLLHFLLTRFPCKAVVTAPSAPQLFDTLWAELRAWARKLPQSWNELLLIESDHLSLKAAPDEAFIAARTSRLENPDALQGIHALHTLLMVDEASGVPEAVYEAAGGSMSTPGAITLLTGNPTRNTGMFWRTHTLERDRWWTARVSCLDSPRVDREWVKEIAERFGENSNAYRVRVLGEFPLAEDDALISAALVEEAMRREVEIDVVAPEVWGLDVARFGADKSVLIKRRGNMVMEPPRRWAGLELMALTGAVYNEIQRCGPKPPDLVLVDSIGLGAGVADRLRELKVKCADVNVAESASSSGRFVRLRDELWQGCADWLATRKVSLPYDEGLRDALCAPRYSFTSDGRLRVESKDSLKSRAVASPDEADALCLTFAPAALSAGAGAGWRWDDPIKRTLGGIV